MSKACTRYKNVISILLLVAMLFVLAGCKDKKTETSSGQTETESQRHVVDGYENEDEMRRLVERLNDTFKDDHFEYEYYFHNIIDAEGNPIPGEGIVVVAKSEKYPDQEIAITNTLTYNGEFYTNYNAIRYMKNMEEYCREIFEERFNCDSCEVKCQSGPTTPIQNMSFEKYYQEHAGFDFDVIMYSNDSTFTEEKQTVDELVQIVKEQNKTCSIDLIYCNEGVDDPFHNFVSFYSLRMSQPNEILYIRVERNSGAEFETLVENMTW